MLGFHGDTGICQTVMCLPGIICLSMCTVYMCACERERESGHGKIDVLRVMSESTLSHKYRVLQCPPPPELTDGGGEQKAD